MNLYDAKRERAATAIHEAGHAVAGVLLGVKIKAVTLPLEPGECPLGFVAAGWTQYAHALSPETEAAVMYAGPWAEARWWNGDDPDLSAIQASLAANYSDADSIADLGVALPRHVEPLLRRCWSSITTLAAQLYGDLHADHADVCAALQIPPDDNTIELAMIRSGSAPGFRVTRPA